MIGNTPVRVLGALLAAAVSFAGLGASAALATTPGTSSNFKLVGHDPLFNRGMNAAMAMYGHYLYIGNRTDAAGTHAANHPGVLVVDVADPSHPKDVGEIAQPPAMAAGYTSRELRVWPQQKALMVIYFGCSSILHACASQSDITGLQPLQQVSFFDLSNPASPVLLSTLKPTATPHEMFLWIDPANGNRAFMYSTSPNSSTKSLIVTDIAGWRTGAFKEIASFDLGSSFTAAGTDGSAYDLRMHSLSITPDGRRGYLAHLGGGFLVIDTSDVASGVPSPVIREVTPIANRASWDNQGAHSSVKIPGKPYAISTEEKYGKGLVLNQAFGDGLGGCPWGWMRVIDIHDETHPKIVAEYKLPENDPAFCAGADTFTQNYTSYASHNPTVTSDIAFVTWHSGGLQAIDIRNPLKPTQAGYFVATPEASVGQEDPALNFGPNQNNKVTAWSYPIIHNGLIYFIDIRNGLYIVKYTGPSAGKVAKIKFLEGNSSAGDAAKLDGYNPVKVTALRVADAIRSDLSDTVGLGLSGLAVVGALVYFARSWRRRPA
ncbi:MAG: hypothetical protein QOK05_254 [Chloroflexota bacterium]|jgi:hypothetical protein|nr:hypothetical protein [Chloroflexota bacterium]